MKASPATTTDSHPPRLRLRTVLCLWWVARADARAGIPAVRPADADADGSAPHSPTTPCLQELDRRRLEAIEGERARLVEQTAELLVRHRTLSARVAQTSDRLREATDAGRREQLHLRLGELHYSLAHLDERIVRECVTAQSRAVRQDELLRRCAARYARTLLRRHPAGTELAGTDWPRPGALPAWVTDPTPAATLLPGSGVPDGPVNPIDLTVRGLDVADPPVTTPLSRIGAR